MSVKIKICGIRRREDAEYINEFIPDYCGFILSEGYKRTVSKQDFPSLQKRISPEIKKVGVFVDEKIQNILWFGKYLDVIQLHGNENGEYVDLLRNNFGGEIWKAVKAKTVSDVESANNLNVDRVLVDSFAGGMAGGTEKVLDACLVKQASISKPFFAAGGINSQNATEIIAKLSPYGVDLSGSVETNGAKDREKIKEIITIIRRIDQNG